MDSGFRRNDGFWTFDEFINFISLETLARSPVAAFKGCRNGTLVHPFFQRKSAFVMEKAVLPAGFFTQGAPDCSDRNYGVIRFLSVMTPK
jgi:hypothetical protein